MRRSTRSRSSPRAQVHRRTLAAALVLLAIGCKRDPSSRDRIPRTTGPIKIDGEWDEPDWPQRALRFQFAGADGQLARPSSEIRLIHDATNLYVGLYAADQNIVSASDAFELAIGPLALRLDPKGHVTPASPGVRVGVDSDGTIDDPKDDDEEWKLEVAMPLGSTGLSPDNHVAVAAKRCDVPKDGIERCGSWSGSLTLER